VWPYSQRNGQTVKNISVALQSTEWTNSDGTIQRGCNEDFFIALRFIRVEANLKGSNSEEDRGLN
jgi:hypothetical protein